MSNAASCIVSKVAVLFISLVLGFSFFSGCNQSADDAKVIIPFNSVVLNSPTVTIDLYHIEEAKPPEEAWSRAMERFGSYLSGELVVNVREPRIETKEDGSKSYILDDEHKRGDYFTVAIFPYSDDIRRGRYMKFNNGWQMIQYDQAGIEQYDWLFPRERLWELVLLHEFGHAIGVPADVSHRDKTGHCTNHCVMYRRPDLRSALRAMQRGLPMDLCDDCRGEIAAAKLVAQ